MKEVLDVCLNYISPCGFHDVRNPGPSRLERLCCKKSLYLHMVGCHSFSNHQLDTSGERTIKGSCATLGEKKKCFQLHSTSVWAISCKTFLFYIYKQAPKLQRSRVDTLNIVVYWSKIHLPQTVTTVGRFLWQYIMQLPCSFSLQCRYTHIRPNTVIWVKSRFILIPVPFMRHYMECCVHCIRICLTYTVISNHTKWHLTIPQISQSTADDIHGRYSNKLLCHSSNFYTSIYYITVYIICHFDEYNNLLWTGVIKDGAIVPIDSPTSVNATTICFITWLEM